jgi:hypothetical protein
MTRIIQLSRMARNCPGCGPDRLFEQHHPEPGGRPDSPDGQCPESCAVPSLRDRVA